MSREPRVTVWNEFRHEQANPKVAEIYPRGIHEALAGPLRAVGLEVATATLDEREHGLDRRRLDATDVLVWWGHRAHDEVADEVVQRVHQRVLDGMGLVAIAVKMCVPIGVSGSRIVTGTSMLKSKTSPQSGQGLCVLRRT